MRFRSIDDYLADLNVLVDHIGAPVDLIGLCQGGWMALTYAARFPAKVRKLVLAGPPIDIAAAPSALSDLAGTSPLAVFDELVRIGDGIVPGRKVLKFWGVDAVAAEDLRQVLQTDELPGSRDFARLEAEFRQWYAWTTDLPGAYFLEVVEKLYKRNELARGKFVALGRRIDLATVHTPIFLLGASEDELVAPLQLLATERLVGTSARDIRKAMAAGRHIGLFMGKNVLENIWPASYDGSASRSRRQLACKHIKLGGPDKAKNPDCAVLTQSGLGHHTGRASQAALTVIFFVDFWLPRSSASSS